MMRSRESFASMTRLQIQKYLTQHHSSGFENDFIQEIEFVKARKQTKDGQVIVLKVPPIDKFRVVIPFAEPGELADLLPILQQWNKRHERKRRDDLLRLNQPSNRKCCDGEYHPEA